MKRIFSLLLAIVILLTSSLTAYADYSNITGGSGTTGTGTNDNGWLITNSSGGYTYDAEGIRVYVVNKAGEPVTKSIDITNSTNLSSAIINGAGATKYQYLYKGKTFSFMKRYEAKNPPSRLPQIIPWGETASASVTRINAIKEWVQDQYNRNWLLEKLGTNIETMRDKGYKFAIEPIAYFRYMGRDYALTATECAVLDKMFKGGIYSKMNPLTHSNLPLAMFLEKNEFTSGAYPLYAWNETGKTIKDNDKIIKYLGIGIFSYSPDEDDEEKDDPDSLNTVIKCSVVATPKEYEVVPPEGFDGIPCQIGRDGYLTVNLKQTKAVYNAWKERLEDVKTVKVTFNVIARTGDKLLSMNGSAYNCGTREMSTADFLALLKKQIKYRDKVTTNEIEPNSRIEYLYRFKITVQFTESDKYTTAGKTITVSSSVEQDTASFFRNSDPPKPEYVTYTSEPTAYAEIKQGTIGNEKYEAMAGVPTTEDLYFGVGGSEFIVDFEAEYNKKQSAERTYKVHYDGIECEFKQGDRPGAFDFPAAPGGTGSTHVESMYVGGTLTVTWSGTTPWIGTTEVNGWQASVTDKWDDTAYNNALAAANSYAAKINGTVFSFTAASDKQTRTYSSWGASATGSNPHSSGSATNGSPAVKDPNTGKVIKAEVPGTATPGTANTWTITVTWTVPKECCAGPCHNHDLPAIEDTWTQKITFDEIAITKAVIWRMEQGYLDGLDTITGGNLSAVNADVLAGMPTLFSNIAATQTSKGGRLRYSLESPSHDKVVWNMGARSNKCDKQDKSWGTGIKYSCSSYPNQVGYLEANTTAKDKKTDEYTVFKQYREKKVTATVISDVLILQTSSGDQSVLYYTKKSNEVQAQQNFNYVSYSLADAWKNNTTSAARWSKSHINIGSYNGKFAAPVTKYNGNGNGNKIATVFDSDPAKTIVRPTRPSENLKIAKYNIDILDTLPNDDYSVGTARVFWNNILNYNKNNTVVPYAIANYAYFTGKGYSKIATYSDNHTRINDIVVHNPVSAEYAMILEIDKNRDQRVSTTYADKMNQYISGCPGNEDCEFSKLVCKYTGSYTHTAACYSAASPKNNNAHQHSLSCLDTDKLNEAYQKDTTIKANTETYVESDVLNAPTGAPFSKYRVLSEMDLGKFETNSSQFSWSADHSYIYAAGNNNLVSLYSGTLNASVDPGTWAMIEYEDVGALGGLYSDSFVIYSVSNTIYGGQKSAGYAYLPIGKVYESSLTSFRASFGTKTGGELRIKSVKFVTEFVSYELGNTSDFTTGIVNNTFGNVSSTVFAGSISSYTGSKICSLQYSNGHTFSSNDNAFLFCFASFDNIQNAVPLTMVFTDGTSITPAPIAKDYYVYYELPSSIVGKTLRQINFTFAPGNASRSSSFSITNLSVMKKHTSSTTYTMTPPISTYTEVGTIPLAGGSTVNGGTATISGSQLVFSSSATTASYIKNGSWTFQSDTYLKIDVASNTGFNEFSVNGYPSGTPNGSKINLIGDTTIWYKIPDAWVGKTIQQLKLNFYHATRSDTITINSIKIVRDGKHAGYAGEKWSTPLVDMNEILVNGKPSPTLAWLRKQPAILFKCNGELNVHICTAACQHDAVLTCNEPHHYGEHYDSCYEACHDDNNHRQQTSTPGSSLNSSMGNFINLDWGFQVYFPTVGNFYQSMLWGIPSTTQIRGKGYYDEMQTAEWVEKKRVKFAFDVIYCGETDTRNINGSQHGNSESGSDNHKHTSACVLYKAGEWIELPKEFELFNFYCPGSNYEYAGATTEFEVVAINSQTGENDGNTQATNRIRYSDFTAKHGAYRKTYIDVVGRIGNVIIEDTGDFRYSNLFKEPVDTDDYYIDGLIKEVDITKKNFVITSTNDLRGLPTDNVFGQDIYGTLSWLRRNLLPFPLSPDKNNINALKNEPVRFGYSVYADVSTLGIDYGTIDIVPCYYYYDLSTGKITPLDVYMIHDNKYQAINIYRNAYEDKKEVFSYNYYLEWERQYQRRNVSESEQSATLSNAERNNLYYPSGKYKVGNADFISFDERARTYIGSTSTKGYNQNIGNLIAPSFFQMSAKRWHFTMGLPSSAVVVEHDSEVTMENIERFSKGTGVVLMAADIYATSNIYTLKYGQPGGHFTINGTTYNLPPEIPFVVAIFGDNSKSSVDDLEIHHTH